MSTSAEIAQVRALIAAHPEAHRRALSQLLCERWCARRPIVNVHFGAS